MRKTISAIGRFIKNLYSKFFSKKSVKYLKTYSYITFDDYFKTYKGSYYQVPTNIEKVKDFDGKLIDLKEGCKYFDKMLLEISHSEIFVTYNKFKNERLH